MREEIAARRARVVAIDGRGGSGKSTLARRLAAGWPSAIVLETDDFYRPAAERGRTAVHGGDYDHERLSREVLEPFTSGHVSRYRRFDWDTGRLAEWHVVRTGGVLVLEGVYSTCERLRRYLDYTIWIDCAYEVRLRRGVERDGELMLPVWTDDWMPAEDRYVEAERPDARADLVLDGSGSCDGDVFRVLKVSEAGARLTSD